MILYCCRCGAPLDGPIYRDEEPFVTWDCPEHGPVVWSPK